MQNSPAMIFRIYVRYFSVITVHLPEWQIKRWVCVSFRYEHLGGREQVLERHHEFKGGRSMHWKWGGGSIQEKHKKIEKGGGCMTSSSQLLW